MPTEIPVGVKQRAVVNVAQNQSIVCPVSVQEKSKWKNIKITLNTEAEVNVISQYFAMKLKLKFMKNVKLSQSEWINKQTVFCYNVYQMIIWTTDVWNQKKNSIHTFYSLNKISVSFILNILYLQTESIIINCITLSWC